MRAFVTGVIQELRDLGAGCHLLTISVPEHVSAEPVPGQFVMLRGPWDTDPLLPRAFSVLAAEPGRLELLVKVVGRGTRRIVALPLGSRVSILGPLGKGFPPPRDDRIQLLVGGGVGIPPLILQAMRARERGLSDHVVLVYGGRRSTDLVLLDRVLRADLTVYPCTEDGSLGTAGRVTDALPPLLERMGGQPVELLGCGPTGMLRALQAVGAALAIPTWISLENEMACGVGVCRGCVVAQARGDGYLCTCEQGPVFRGEEVSL